MTKSVTLLVSVLVCGITLEISSALAQDSAGKLIVLNASRLKAQGAGGMPGQPTSRLTGQKEKASYALGFNLGTSLRRQFVEVDPDILLQGLKDALGGQERLMTDDEARDALVQMQKDLKAKQEESIKQVAQKNKTEGQAFLAANKHKGGIVTLASGLQYKVLIQGVGRRPTLSDMVVCNYRATLIDGTEFDSSYKRGHPASLSVSGVIKGWTEALQLMPVGSKWQLFIPSELAYGEGSPANDVGPNATLIFEVELISIQSKQ